MRSDERGRVHPDGILNPLRVQLVRAGVRIWREPRTHQIFQHEAWHLRSHGGAAFNPNMPRRTELGERHAVGRWLGAGHEESKYAACPQGPIGAHVQKLNGV